MEMGDDDFDFTRNMVRRLLPSSPCRSPKWGKSETCRPSAAGRAMRPCRPASRQTLISTCILPSCAQRPRALPLRALRSHPPLACHDSGLWRNAFRCRACKVDMCRCHMTIPTRAPPSGRRFKRIRLIAQPHALSVPLACVRRVHAAHGHITPLECPHTPCRLRTRGGHPRHLPHIRPNRHRHRPVGPPHARRQRRSVRMVIEGAAAAGVGWRARSRSRAEGRSSMRSDAQAATAKTIAGAPWVARRRWASPRPLYVPRRPRRPLCCVVSGKLAR